MRRPVKAVVTTSMLLILTWALGLVPASAQGACPNEAIREVQGATQLPECRAYELVSNPDKNVGDIVRVPKVSDDGNAAVYSGTGGELDTAGKDIVSVTLARRTDSGWSHSNSSPKLAEFQPSTSWPLAYSDDFSHSIFFSNGTHSPDDQNYAADLYDVAVPSGDAELLTGFEHYPKTESPQLFFGGITPGLHHILISYTGSTGLPGSPPEGTLEVYDLADGEWKLVSILPDGSTASAAYLAGGGVEYGRSGTDVHRLTMPPPHSSAEGISADGSHIFWFAGDGGLYVRLHGMTTQAVSRSQTSSDATTVAAAGFIGATEDGSAAYFLSEAQLTDDAPAPSPGAQTLYRYEVDTDSLTAVTSGPEPAGVTDAMLSENGSRLYFIGSGVYAPGATAGEANVYVWDTTTHETRFIATVNSVHPTDYIARLSADGNWALIAATASLAGATIDGHDGLYLYDWKADKLSCVSCRVDGSPSQGDASLQLPPPANYTNGSGGWRNLTDDGRVFFNSTDHLVPRDLSAAQDVYEYDPRGSTELISSGRSHYPSYYMENTDDGSSVFFVTRSELVQQDPDELLDLYAARVDGGFADGVRSGAPCVGEECQGPGPRAPDASTPGSQTFRGAGNVRVGSKRCTVLRQRSAHLRRSADRLRRAAAGAQDSSRARQLAAEAARFSNRAKKVKQRAAACRRARADGTSRSRGAAR